MGGAGWGTLVDRLKMTKVYLDGRATPASLWTFINLIDSDDEALKQAVVTTDHLPYDISGTLMEIFRKKHESPKEYGAVMGKLKSDLDWLSSPQVAASISGEEDYLRFLGDPDHKAGIYYCLEGGSGKHNESLTRMVVGIAMLHCIRAGKGHRPLFYLDEAATCGNAEFMKSAASEFRKYFRTIFVYQSKGQLDGLFGKAGAQEIIDSCGQIVVLGGGLRDVESADILPRWWAKPPCMRMMRWRRPIGAIRPIRPGITRYGRAAILLPPHAPITMK